VISTKRIGLRNAIALDRNDIVHIATSKAGGGESSSIVAVSLKGAKLSLSVVPKEAGAITVTPSGLQCSSKASGFYHPGAELALAAVANPGFTFVEWTQDGSGTDPDVSVVLDKNRKVTAKFAAAP
jgi:uncharacterized repeat protein (TIGR02543 family)